MYSLQRLQRAGIGVLMVILKIVHHVLESEECCVCALLTDRDECSEDREICGQHAKCINTIGGYYCICDQGYRPASGETNFTGNGSCERKEVLPAVHVSHFRL